MKLANTRAFALACRPVGKTAHRSCGGNSQSANTTFTAPDLSSGANIQSEAMARPSPANTDVEDRVLRQERGKPRHDVKPRKGHRRADAQTSRQGCARTARGDFRFIGFLDRAFCAVIKIAPRLGRAQSVGRAQQQTNPEPLLELRDGLGN